MQSMFTVNGMRLAGGGITLMASIAFLVGIAITIFWMVTGWRAMRAHERLAEAVEDLSMQKK